MGAIESSRAQLQEWQKETPPIYSTDFYRLHKGTLNDGSNVSVFQAVKTEPPNNDLERSVRFLRILRHPCILKHIQSGKEKRCFYLLTEEVTPLEALLTKGDVASIDITAGLQNILLALQFLHEKCSIRHNNVSTSSIFVASDRSWKLGGFECSEKFDENNKSSPSLSKDANSKDLIHTTDILAYGELASQLLSSQVDNPKVVNFLELIKDTCLNVDPTKRANSATLHLDSFFRSLCERLFFYEPSTIANHMMHLFFSRLVFLESSARTYFLPSLLRPKTDSCQSGLLPPELFKTHVIPRIEKILSIHDRHIRLIILEHFCHFAHLFSKEELNDLVLPEILLGVRDNNNEMVAASLGALATLVHLLGATTVIGGNNQRVFTENIPSHSLKAKHALKSLPVSASSPDTRKTSDMSVYVAQNEIPKHERIEPCITESNNLASTVNDFQSQLLIIPERSSPDGGESPENEDWSDWEEEAATTTNNSLVASQEILSNESSLLNDDDILKNKIKTENLALESNRMTETSEVLKSGRKLSSGLGEEFDIMALDIRKVKSTGVEEENYFVDMEPQLIPSKQSNLQTKENINSNNKPRSLFHVLVENDNDACSGWDDSTLQIDW